MSIVYGVLVVGGACLAAVVGLTVVQRLVPVTIREEHNDVAGFIYAVLGVIYAVLLALVVIATWEEFGRARVTVESEANALAEIFWLAHELPEPEGPHLQELARSYAEVVVDEEWPQMQQGRTPLMEQTQETTPGWVLIDDIRATVQEVEPRTQADQELYAEGLDQVQRLADARRTRLVQAEEGIAAVLWVVLVVGGMVTVGFAYLFGLANTWAHRLMVVSLAGVIALVLFTVGAMNYPFSGAPVSARRPSSWCSTGSRRASSATSESQRCCDRGSKAQGGGWGS
jgi:protein-S-isoprenylcysteine O-methyltransferase Ste14